MKITLAILLLLIGTFVYWAFDRYEYRDFSVTDCPTGIEATLTGDYGAESPYIRGAPYTLRLVLASNQVGANLDVSVRLTFIEPSIAKQIVIENSKYDVSEYQGNKIILMRPINIPYQDYIMKFQMEQQSIGPIYVECKIMRNYSEEIRLRFWDNLLSV